MLVKVAMCYVWAVWYSILLQHLTCTCSPCKAFKSEMSFALPHQDLLWLLVVFLYAQSSTTCKVFKRTVFGQSESSLWALLAPVLHSKKLSLSLSFFQTAKQDIITTGKGYKKEDWLWDKYCKKIYHSYRCAHWAATQAPLMWRTCLLWWSEELAGNHI